LWEAEMAMAPNWLISNPRNSLWSVVTTREGCNSP